MNDDASEGVSIEIDAAIPAVVQRALGMQNLKDQVSSSDDAIYGLKGCLLPRYISLRLAHYYGQQHATSLPPALIRTQEEEHHHRRCCNRKETQHDSHNRKGSSRTRKRKASTSDKSKSDAIVRAVNVTYKCNDVKDGKSMPDKKQCIDGRNTPKGRRHRNRKRRKNSQGNDVTSDAEAFSKNGSSNWIHYQIVGQVLRETKRVSWDSKVREKVF